MSNPDMNAMATEMLAQADLEPYSYSGRGMMGRECLAVNADGALGMFASVLQAITEMGEEPGELNLLMEMMRSARTDNMGHGVVVYWPDLEFLPEDEEDGDEPDDSGADADVLRGAGMGEDHGG